MIDLPTHEEKGMKVYPSRLATMAPICIPTQLEKRQQAEMAVHLAATSVQWFASGLIHRTP